MKRNWKKKLPSCPWVWITLTDINVMGSKLCWAQLEGYGSSTLRNSSDEENMKNGSLGDFSELSKVLPQTFHIVVFLCYLFISIQTVISYFPILDKISQMIPHLWTLEDVQWCLLTCAMEMCLGNETSSFSSSSSSLCTLKICCRWSPNPWSRCCMWRTVGRRRGRRSPILCMDIHLRT